MATIDDVAKRSGVSAMTVSRVMNQRGSVTDVTRKKVLAAAEELGYRPNLIARSLATSRTNTIGVLITHFENPLYSAFLSAMIRESEVLGYELIIGGAEDVNGSIKSMNTLIGKCVDGLVIFPPEFRNDTGGVKGVMNALEMDQSFFDSAQGIFADLEQRNIPVVALGDYKVEKLKGRVRIDYYTSGYMAVEYLRRCGHKRIGCISHVAGDLGLWGERYRGFLDGVREFGLTVKDNWVVKSIDTVESGFYAMQNLIEGNRDMPTAIWCANDMIAVGAISAAVGKGLRIPEDLSIVGNDGSYVREITVPRLTTVSIQPEEIGISCMRQLHGLIAGQEPEEEITVPPKILEGRSVRILQE